MLVIVAAMLAIAIWEAPNLYRLWDKGERCTFWVSWGAMLVWALLVETHVRLPTMTQVTNTIFRHWSAMILTPRPNIYW